MDEDHSDSMTSFSAISTLLTENSPVGHNNGAKTEDFWSLDHGRKTKPLLNPIHAYFQYNEETGCSHCRLCPEKMKGRWTSNLKRHISSKHAGHYIDFLNHMADLSGGGNCSAPIPNLTTSSTQQKNMLMNYHHQQSATATVIVPPLIKNMTVKNRPNIASLQGLGQGAGGSKNRDLMASSFAGEDGSSNQDEDEESESDSFHLFEKTNLKIKPRRSVGQANETPNYFLAAAENRRRINDDKLNCIAQAFIYNNLPCRLMDETNFKRMFTVVSNGAMLAPPSGRQVEDQIRWLSDHLKSKIAEKIQKSQHISLSSRFFFGEKSEGENSKKAFLFVACHFFDKESDCLKNYLLSCKSMNWDANQNLNSLINETLDEWSIDQKKIFRVMTDNKSEVSTMIRHSITCGRSLKTNAFVNDSTINQNNSSGASSIYKKTKFEIDEVSLENVDVENFEKEESKMNDLLDKKRLSYFFDELVVAIQKVLDNSNFKSIQIQIRNFLDAFHLISPLKEKSAVMIGNRYLPKLSSSLWIQWYYLLEALLEIKDEIKEICRKYPTSFNLYPQDFSCMEESVIVLKPIISTINNSGRLENDLSVAALYPILFGLVTKLRRIAANSDAKFTVELTNTIEKEIRCRFAKICDPKSPNFDPTYVMATLLDPRYGLLLKDELLIKAKQQVYLSAQPILGSKFKLRPQPEFEQCSKEPSFNENSSQSSDDDVLSIAKAAVAQKRRSDHQSAGQQSSAAMSSADEKLNSVLTSFLDLEMQIYDTESQCLQNEDLNPFDFWSQRKDSLPILSTVAGVILAAPANFCAIDRILANCSLSTKKDERHQNCSGWMTGDRDGFGLETFFRYNNNAKELL